jgi:hypothetical protein
MFDDIVCSFAKAEMRCTDKPLNIANNLVYQCCYNIGGLKFMNKMLHASKIEKKLNNMVRTIKDCITFAISRNKNSKNKADLLTNRNKSNMEKDTSQTPSKEGKIYSFEELIKYQETINNYAKGEGQRFIRNDSVVHASLIMKCFFEHSKSVNMYCGKFSIFRPCFKEKIDKMLADKTYDEERDKKEFEKISPYKECVDSLEDFLAKGGKMNVITDKDITSIKNEPIWDIIEKYVGDSLHFYRRNDPYFSEVFHYTVVDGTTYRTENDKDERTAICCFHDTTGNAGTLNAFFNMMKRKAEEVKF